MARKFGRIQQFFHIDSRVVAHAFQKIDQIFGREISARAGAIRTAAQTRGGGVELANSCVKPRQCVGQTSPVGVVKMEDEIVRLQFQIA